MIKLEFAETCHFSVFCDTASRIQSIVIDSPDGNSITLNQKDYARLYQALFDLRSKELSFESKIKPNLEERMHGLQQ